MRRIPQVYLILALIIRARENGATIIIANLGDRSFNQLLLTRTTTITHRNQHAHHRTGIPRLPIDVKILTNKVTHPTSQVSARADTFTTTSGIHGANIPPQSFPAPARPLPQEMHAFLKPPITHR